MTTPTAATMDPEAEPPSLLWGSDPVFAAFARLYVRDILEMRESCQVPGIYLYNSHPIYKVDVLGTVVYKRERENYFCYGVDDGTGVISCLCWKSERWREQDSPAKSGAKSTDDAQGSFNPVTELKKLRQAQQSSCRLEIGELLRIRGPVKTFRQQREITASTFYKVEDPVMATQIAWMMEAPQLYRQCYDKPLQLQPTTSGSAVSRCTQAMCVLKNFFKEKAVTKFRPYEVQDLLQHLVSSRSSTSSANQGEEPQTPHLGNPTQKSLDTPLTQEPVAGPSGSQQLRQLLQEALQLLQEEGTVFRKVRSQDEVYHVTEQDKGLLIAVKDVIRKDSRTEKYAEKGCHILHILSAVRQCYSPNVSKAAVERILNSLESNSDIISTSDSHYTIFGETTSLGQS